MSEQHTFSKTLAPANGLLVIDPATSRALPEHGALVQGNPEYWICRINEGDVTEVELPPADAEDNQL